MSSVQATLPNEFFAVAQRVYAQDPLWLPESADAVRLQWRDAIHSDPSLQVWFDVVPDRARLAGFYHDRQVIDGRRTAFFGFWEGVEDLEAHRRLFQRFEHWARGQGAEQVVGPINITTFANYRIRLNEFERGAFPGEPYNPAYYPAFLTELNYQPCKHFHSWFGELAGRASTWASHFEPALDRLREQGWMFDPMSAYDWTHQLESIYRLVDVIFGQNYAYRGISLDAFKRGYGESLAQRFCQHASVKVTDPNGQLAAFFLMFPDYGPLMCQGNDFPLPPPFVRFQEHYPALPHKRLLGKTGGVDPNYRQLGLFGLMSYLAACWGETLYETTGAVLVREDNPSRKVAEQMFSRPGDWRHDYALFARSL